MYYLFLLNDGSKMKRIVWYDFSPLAWLCCFYIGSWNRLSMCGWLVILHIYQLLSIMVNDHCVGVAISHRKPHNCTVFFCFFVRLCCIVCLFVSFLFFVLFCLFFVFVFCFLSVVVVNQALLGIFLQFQSKMFTFSTMLSSNWHAVTNL